MELLFNKFEDGTEQLKTLLGFVDADINFEDIKSNIITATNKVRKEIGKTIYQKVLGEYKNQTKSELLYHVQFSIAIRAYALYAPNNDVSHSNNGRLIRRDERVASAFPWQIQQSNASLEKSYYRAMDDLLLYLDENVDEWKETDEYKQSMELFIRNVDDVQNHFYINGSRYFFIKIIPGIRKAQRGLIAVLGKEKYEELKTAYKSNEGVSDNDTELFEYIQEHLVYSALQWGTRRLSIQLLPDGIYQSISDISDKGKVTANALVRAEAGQQFKVDAQDALNEIHRLISESTIEETTDSDYLPDFDFGSDIDDNFVNT